MKHPSPDRTRRSRAGIAMTASRRRADKILLRFSTAAPPPDFLSKSLERFKEEVDKAAPNQFEVSCIRARACSARAPRCRRSSAAISK